MTTDQQAHEALRALVREPVELPGDGLEAVLAAVQHSPQVRSRLPDVDSGRVQSMIAAIKPILAGVIVALFGGFLVISQPIDRQGTTAPGAASDGSFPPVTGPAGNGLIAFSRDGDIYVGDPVAGESEALIAGPWMDEDPKFSPDGTHIAFRRVHAPDEARDEMVNSNVDADWVVVRADGSDERVLKPTYGPFGRGQGDFVWSPDGRSLVVTQATGGGPTFSFFLVDAAGVADVRPLASPAPRGFSGAQVAWFLRPPTADRVMAWSWDSSVLTATNLDSSDVVDLGALSGLDEAGYGSVRWPAWSPDASRILVSAVTSGVESHLYVMDADGSDLRRLGEAGDAGDRPVWSPDGSLIASQRWMEVEPGSIDDRQTSGHAGGCTWATWISVVDVETGMLRDLEASRLNPGVAEPASGCPGIGGWSWSPDGRDILMHGEPGTRPIVVDVASDTSTELPWESDSAPSWQRVAAD